MKVMLALVGIAIMLSGCCGFTGGPYGNTSPGVPQGPSGRAADLNSCLSDCDTNSIPGNSGLAGVASCKAVCYSDDAKANLNAGECDKILDLGNFSTFGENATFWFNGCVGDVAESKPDVSICSKIPVGQGRDGCIMNVYYVTKNPADCAGLNDSTMKNACQ